MMEAIREGSHGQLLLELQPEGEGIQVIYGSLVFRMSEIVENVIIIYLLGTWHGHQILT